MKFSNLAIAYSAKRKARTKSPAPVYEEVPEELEAAMPIIDEDEDPELPPDPAEAKPKVDVASIIKKHRFFASRRNED